MPELTLDQGTIRYRDEGAGPTLFFVHGALVDGRLWDPVVARLRDRFRCVVPDLPLGSHERPMQPDADLTPHGVANLIADMLERLDLRDVTLIGNDSGGALSQLLVVAPPQRGGGPGVADCDAVGDFPPQAVKAPTAARARGAPGADRLRRVRRLPAQGVQGPHGRRQGARRAARHAHPDAPAARAPPAAGLRLAVQAADPR